MKANEKRRVIEALILASKDPISAVRLAEILPRCTPAAAKDLVNELNTEYQEQDRAFEIWEVAGGYQLRTRAEFSGYLQQLQKQRPLRLSRAALETLAIVAYKQPATRADLEYVRGVESGAVIKSLLDRQLVKIVGHKDVPGRPILYATNRRFLETFGLKTIKDLPPLRELEELAREQGVSVSEDGEEGEGAEPISIELAEIDEAQLDGVEDAVESSDASPDDSGSASDVAPDVESVAQATTSEDLADEDVDRGA